MNRPTSLTFWLIAVVLLLISPVVQGRDDDDDDKDNIYSCSSEVCLECDSSDTYCISCEKGYYLNTLTGNCEDRKKTRDRGDSMSKAVGVINIIFIIVLVHTWLYLSRNNMRRYIRSSGNDSDERITLNAGGAQQPGLSQQPNVDLIRIGAPSEGGSSYDLRSRISSVSQSPQPLADFQKPQAKNMLEQAAATDQPIQAVAYPINLQQQQQQAYPASIQMGIPLGQNYPMVQQSQQPSQQPAALGQDPQFVSRDLNGYWLTQAGKFSFVGLSNFHRVKHMVLNIMMLEQIMAMLLYESGRRGDDSDEDSRKKLLFLAFSLAVLIYWVYTLLPPLVIKIFSCCLCLKTDPWGRASTIFLNFLFYFFSIIIVVSLTSMIFRLDGFEAQVWVLLVLAAFLLIIFFDKKSIEIAKKYKGGYLEALIKFRKMDFLIPTVQQQRQQEQQQNQQQQMQPVQV